MCVVLCFILVATGCSTKKEVSESQIVDDVNNYLSDLGSELVAANVSIVDRSLNDEGYNDTIYCDIDANANVSGLALEGTLKCYVVYDYYDEEGWVLSSVSLDDGYWKTEMNPDIVGEFILKCDNEIMKGYKEGYSYISTGQCETNYINEENGLYTFELRCDAYDYGIMTATIKTDEMIRIDTDTFRLWVDYLVYDQKDIEWRSLDGNWTACLEDDKGITCDISFTINNNVITSFSGRNSNGESFSLDHDCELVEVSSHIGYPLLVDEIFLHSAQLDTFEQFEEFEIEFSYYSAAIRAIRDIGYAGGCKANLIRE